MFFSPALLLEELSLRFQPANNAVLSDSLFSEEFPLLRRLALYNKRISPKSMMLLNPLTSLKMSSDSNASYLQYPIDQIVSILQHLPTLHVLDLQGILAPIEAPSFIPAQWTVQLPQLTLLRVNSGVLASSHFLDHLAFCSTTSLDASRTAGFRIFEPTCLIPCLSYWGELYRCGQPDPIRFAKFLYEHQAFILEIWSSYDRTHAPLT